MRSIAVTLLVLVISAPAWALPNMIRLGYPNCVSCHVAPQGGGLLNAYGRGIDEGQSRRGGEYVAGADPLLNNLNLNGRIDQDFRAVTSLQLNHSLGGSYKGVDRIRFFYRNVTTIGAGFRVSAVVDGEHEPSLRKSTPYDPVSRPDRVLVTSALLQYRPKDGIEIAAGQDALPAGLNIPDQTTFIKSRVPATCRSSSIPANGLPSPASRNASALKPRIRKTFEPIRANSHCVSPAISRSVFARAFSTMSSRAAKRRSQALN